MKQRQRLAQQHQRGVPLGVAGRLRLAPKLCLPGRLPPLLVLDRSLRGQAAAATPPCLACFPRPGNHRGANLTTRDKGLPSRQLRPPHLTCFAELPIDPPHPLACLPAGRRDNLNNQPALPSSTYTSRSDRPASLISVKQGSWPFFLPGRGRLSLSDPCS
jgi:hypothetical protein